MQKKKIKSLHLSKHVIAKIQLSAQQQLKGGTEPISPPMSQRPDDQGICYAPK